MVKMDLTAGSFCRHCSAHSRAMDQNGDEKWIVVVDLQPTIHSPTGAYGRTPGVSSGMPTARFTR